MTSREIRLECERIWCFERISHPMHIAGWLPKLEAQKRNIGFWSGLSYKLVRIRCRMIPLYKVKRFNTKWLPDHLTEFGKEYAYRQRTGSYMDE